MTVTIKDVARQAGVSPKTVSRVLNAEAHVRPALRETVMRVIKELDYKPNMFARSLSSARSYLLGLFVDDPSWSGYAAGMQLGALRRCRDRSYHLVVEPLDISASDWEEEMTNGIAALRLDGAILTPPLCTHAPLLERIEQLGLAYVRISPGEDIERSGLVEIDERRAAYDMTSYLIGLGHRDIGFIEGIPSHAATPKRRAGFLAAMHEAGLPVKPGRIQPGDFSFHAGFEGGEAMLRRADDRPTAIFGSNDDTALGVFAAASKHGLSVPDDLSVAGFDDSPTARVAWPPITTVRQPVGDMAAEAVDILADATYRTAPGDPRFRRQLPYEIVYRGSTAPPRPA